MKLRPGQYYYAPHRNMWGVWKAGEIKNGVQMDDFISDFATKIQAERFVKKMNFNAIKKTDDDEEL